MTTYCNLNKYLQKQNKEHWKPSENIFVIYLTLEPFGYADRFYKFVTNEVQLLLEDNKTALELFKKHPYHHMSCYEFELLMHIIAQLGIQNTLYLNEIIDKPGQLLRQYLDNNFSKEMKTFSTNYLKQDTLGEIRNQLDKSALEDAILRHLHSGDLPADQLINLPVPLIGDSILKK